MSIIFLVELYVQFKGKKEKFFFVITLHQSLAYR